jgi:hypothetical protein
MREERVVLEDHPDVAALRGDPGRAGDGAAVEADRAGVGLLEARDQAEHRGLPAAARAEDGEQLSALDREARVTHGVDRAEALGDPLQLDHGRGFVQGDLGFPNFEGRET